MARPSSMEPFSPRVTAVMIPEATSPEGRRIRPARSNAAGGAVARDREMNGLGDLAAATKSYSIDGGDDRFLKGLHSSGHRLPSSNERLHRRVRSLLHALRKFADVRARRKGALASACHDDCTDVSIVLDLVEDPHHAIDQRIVERIQY